MNGNRNVGPVMAVGDIPKPKGLIDILSLIQRISSVEQGGGELPENYVTIKEKFYFVTVGFKVSFISSLVMGLLMPLAISVIAGKLPIFGTMSQSLFDKAYIMIFTVSVSLGYAFLIGTSLKSCGSLNATKALIKNFLSGFNSGVILKCVVLFVGFHTLYFLFPEDRIFRFFSFLADDYGQNQWAYKAINSVYKLTLIFRSVLLESAYFTVVTGVMSIAIIYAYLIVGRRKIKKKNAYEY